ncbi:NAD(P)H-dependent flavin oxidoreductase [Sediminibacillus albus]|uniref:Probable nitronate monooxygenase n=1 Tax=Sediminibacillus albus TaxID=407036 RepID=A0A1G9A2V1_9BACI|nr:nitronate monooxygenase [Sediminibacillus albus]SDK20720.1 nitronate monooxygenase [Sediminibacillus albus]
MELSSFFTYPIIQAPMAGGTANPALAAAVSNAGGLGFLAAGYKLPEEVHQEIADMRKRTDKFFGVNLFVPGGRSVETKAVESYAKRLEKTARSLGVDVGEAKTDDDGWDEKLAVLIEERVAIVSFTFGCPSSNVIDRLKNCGIYVIVTVTTPEEAVTAYQAGADALCLQGIEAGGHRSSFTNDRQGEDYSLLVLLRLVCHQIELPIIAAGGIMHGKDIAALLTAGADAVQLGTAFLRCPESGASELHKQALADNSFSETTVTRAFTGRRARGLVNQFINEYSEFAPAAYPHVHYMTKNIRKAAGKSGNPQLMALWAGQGHKLASDLPAEEVMALLLKQALQAKETAHQKKI